jgi:NADH dehydrogenase
MATSAAANWETSQASSAMTRPHDTASSRLNRERHALVTNGGLSRAPQGASSVAPTGCDPCEHVVIIGGGFGGLSAARALRRLPVRVTLIDRRNYHLFQPLLYQVATAGLSPADIASPIRAILRRQRNVTVLLGKVGGIDVAGKAVLLDEKRIAYDQLIVATGARHGYFD